MSSLKQSTELEGVSLLVMVAQVKKEMGGCEMAIVSDEADEFSAFSSNDEQVITASGMFVILEMDEGCVFFKKMNDGRIDGNNS